MLGAEWELNRSIKKRYEQDRSDKFDKRKSKLPLLKHNNYTFMNTTCANILMEIQDKNSVKWVGKLKEN